jgi:hypothetical protein
MSGFTPNVTARLTSSGAAVTTIVSDPNTKVSYTFTSGNLTGSPLIGYSMGLSNNGSGTCGISSNPFSVAIPPFNQAYGGPSVISTVYSSNCVPSTGNWYLQFSFDTVTLASATSKERPNPGQLVTYPFKFGLDDFYITDIGCDGVQFYCSYTGSSGVENVAAVDKNSVVTVRYQFRNGSVSLIVNNVTKTTFQTTSTTPQHVVFLCGFIGPPPPPFVPARGYPSMLLTNIVLGLPSQTFTPSLEYYNSSGELFPYLINLSSSAISFVTPGALLFQDETPSTITLNQVFSNEIQSTISYPVSQTGIVPDTLINVIPSFPSKLLVRGLTPFSYSFTSTNYYPPPDYIQGFSSLGKTNVVITGTNTAVVSMPKRFTDIQVSGDRLYDLHYLYVNNIQLSIDIPFFTSPVDIADFGLIETITATPYLGYITGGGSGTNTLTFVSVYSYTTPQTLTFVPSPFTVNGVDVIAIFFNVYAVSASGTSNLMTQTPPVTIGTQSSFSFSMAVQSVDGYAGNDLTTIFRGPSNRQLYLPSGLPLSLDVFASGTSLLQPFTTGQGSKIMTVSSTTGFTTSTTTPLLWKVDAIANGSVIATIQTLLTILQGKIYSVPELLPPSLSTYIFTPFSYVFSLSNSPTTTLIYYNSDPIIRNYMTSNYNSTSLTFSSTTGFTSSTSNALLSVQAVGTDGSIISELNIYVSASANIITSVPPFTGRITLYKYEPFLYKYGFVPGVTGLTLSPAASSAEARTFTSVATDSLTFNYAGTYQTSYASSINLIATALYFSNNSNNTVVTLSNIVNVNPGRFSNPVSTSFTFYQYEDVSLTYGSNIAFDTAASLDNPPGASPALPPGLYFASVAGSSNNFVLRGAPTFQYPSIQYLILGTNSLTHQTVTTRININVRPPHIQITPRSLAVSGMKIGTPITPTKFTAIQPAALTILGFQYDWDTLPDGLVFKDLNGNTVSQPFYPTDPNLSLILTGTPTTKAALDFVNAGLTVYTVKLYAFQYQPKGVVTNQIALITFSFGETILFANTVIPILYASQPVVSGSFIIKAASYFPTGDPIASITVNSLPDGLAIANPITGIPYYVNGVDYANGVLVLGTPTTVSSGTYSVTATSIGGFTNSYDLSIPVLQDVVSFTSVTPPSAVFIVSRPINLDYTLSFTAVSVITTQTITYTTSFDITKYGLSLSVFDGTATIIGTPTQPLTTTTLIITATDTLGTFANVPIDITINADQFTFNTVSLNFIQNSQITPVQFSATTSSERLVVSYLSYDLPAGLNLSLLGLLTGTPTVSTGGTFHIVGSTGYPVGGTGEFSYSVLADNALILLTQNPLVVPSYIFSIDAFRTFTYSGHTPVLTIDQQSIKDKNENNGQNYLYLFITGNSLNGTIIAGAAALSPFTFNVIGTYLNTTVILPLQLSFNGTTGSIVTETSQGNLRFSSPATTTYLFYQYCPIPPIVFRVSGSSGFTYFYTVTTNLPVGLTFTPDPSGTFATITGSPALYNDGISSLTVYAVNNGYITFQTIQIRVITPFFVNPQDNGASAYTSLLRNQVVVNAAQNARDNVVFPTTDASLGFLQSPGAPDVKSPPVPCCDVKIK